MFERRDRTGGLLGPPEMRRPVLSEGGVGCVFDPTAAQPAGGSWAAVTEVMRPGIRERQAQVRFLALGFPLEEASLLLPELQDGNGESVCSESRREDSAR